MHRLMRCKGTVAVAELHCGVDDDTPLSGAIIEEKDALDVPELFCRGSGQPGYRRPFPAPHCCRGDSTIDGQ